MIYANNFSDSQSLSVEYKNYKISILFVQLNRLNVKVATYTTFEHED